MCVATPARAVRAGGRHRSLERAPRVRVCVLPQASGMARRTQSDHGKFMYRVV